MVEKHGFEGRWERVAEMVGVFEVEMEMVTGVAGLRWETEGCRFARRHNLATIHA